MTEGSRPTALISGASIAGPALAYWLHRYGFEVTVVEKASSLRDGGYPIDVRGTAVDAATRMGILPWIQDAHIDTKRLNFVNEKGQRIAQLRPEALTGGVEGRDYELPRGALAAGLWEVTRDRVEYVFGDSIATIDDRGDVVEVTLESGTERTFDYVFGADGLHSNTRRLVFGPEGDFDRYLGWSFAGFTLPNDYGLSHESMSLNIPGRSAILFASGELPDRLYGFLIVKCPRPTDAVLRDNEAMRQLLIDEFEQDTRWEIPRLVAGLREADDVFADSVSQIHMPRWSKGRVALVGDAAHATSFLSGQGSSCALVTPYFLAGELASRNGDHRAAFEAYERLTRPFVEQNQAIADNSNPVCIPSRRRMWVWRAVFKVVPLLARLGIVERLAAKNREANSALSLPDYDVGIAPSAGTRS